MTNRKPRRRPIRTATVVAACVLPGCVLAPTLVGAAATAPPALVGLEQKWAELKITSLRFSAHTSIHVEHGSRGIQCLLKFLVPGSQSGEYTTSPAAARVSFELLGTKWTFRQVGNRVYAYIHQLAAYDHDRPWVRLGKGGLSELIIVKGRRVRSGAETELLPPRPKFTEPPFSVFNKFLADAREVRELGPATVDGQSVMRFLVVLEPDQLGTELSATTSGVTRVNRSSTDTVELALAASGLPVRTAITVDTSDVTTMYTVEIPAVNFPLVISAPPASKTITLHRLRHLERRRHSKRATKSHHPRDPLAGCANGGASVSTAASAG